MATKKQRKRAASSRRRTTARTAFTPEPTPPEEPVWTRSLTEFGTDLRIAVLGTSISWGQGLWPKDKAAVRCAKMLMADPGFAKAAVASYAQSGAVLWPAQTSNVLGKTGLEVHALSQTATQLSSLSPPAEAARNFSSLDGETPRDTPYLWDQAARASVDFKNAGVKPTFIWLDAGANDIGFMTAVIKKDAATCTPYLNACLNNMKASLQALLRAIWHDPHLGGVPMVLTGYYRAVSAIGLKRAHDAPALIDAAMDWVGGDIGLVSTREQVTANMSKFVTCIQQQWRTIVATLAAEHISVQYVEPAFTDAHVMFAAGTSALWPRAKPPFDSLHGHRRIDSTDGSAFSHLSAAVMTDIAGFAHPNARGAQLYADAVHAAVRTIVHP